MITNKMYTWFLISVASFLSTGSAVFGAVFLVSNTNNQGPGSLRQAIENVNMLGGASNEIIISLVDGKITVFLLSELPAITKQVTLNGFDHVSQQPIIIDGNGNATSGLRVSGADASNTLITNIGIQNITNNAVDGPAYGILIENNANNCSVTNCTIQTVCSGVGSSAEAAGIRADVIVSATGGITNNRIIAVKSADNLAGDSGDASGIFIELTVNGDCSQNTISDISTGTSSQTSGITKGIELGDLHGDCSKNVLTAMCSGVSSNGESGEASGILIDQIISGNCSDNAVIGIKSGEAQHATGNIVGINIDQIQSGSCNGNTIADLFSGNSQVGESGDVRGMLFEEITIGSCSKNTIRNLTSGLTGNSENSGNVTGIVIVQSVVVVTHNRIEKLHSGETEGSSGTLFGILIAGAINGRCSYNTVDTLSSGTSSASGNITGMFILELFDDCTNNSIKNVRSGDELDGPNGSVTGINILSFSGNCLNNAVCNLTVGQPTATSPKEVVGISLRNMTDLQLVACNHIYALTGGDVSIGLFIGKVPQKVTVVSEFQNVTIKLNTIYDIHSVENDAYGIFISDVDNSLITKNSISGITSEQGSGFGVNLAESIGNDILTNSIFDIDTKAINSIDNGLPTDARIVLNFARCADGCRLIISGQLIPSLELGSADQFLIQFFVSSDNAPPETKTFIGEYIHDSSQGASFSVRLTLKTATQFGQFITATATALFDGSQENLNTSEVSNAISSCASSNNIFCPCPEPDKPSMPCPALANCGDFIL